MAFYHMRCCFGPKQWSANWFYIFAILLQRVMLFKMYTVYSIRVEWFSTFPRFLKLDPFTAADQVYFWNFNSKNSQMWLSDCAAKFSFSKIHRDLKMHIFCKLQKSFFFLLQRATSKKKIQKISNNFVMPPTEVGQNWCLLGQRKNQKNFELLFIFSFKNKEDILESGPKTFWNTITSV